MRTENENDLTLEFLQDTRLGWTNLNVRDKLLYVVHMSVDSQVGSHTIKSLWNRGNGHFTPAIYTPLDSGRSLISY